MKIWETPRDGQVRGSNLRNDPLRDATPFHPWPEVCFINVGTRSCGTRSGTETNLRNGNGTGTEIVRTDGNGNGKWNSVPGNRGTGTEN